jgi:hypothetical protein
MMFVKYNGAANNDFMKLKVKLDAKTVILLHSITLGEEKLNRYLIDTEGLDLIKASLYLAGALQNIPRQRRHGNNAVRQQASR